MYTVSNKYREHDCICKYLKLDSHITQIMQHKKCCPCYPMAAFTHDTNSFMKSFMSEENAACSIICVARFVSGECCTSINHIIQQLTFTHNITYVTPKVSSMLFNVSIHT